MDHRGQGQHHRSPPGGAAFAGEHRGKKNAASLLAQWEQLWNQCAPQAATTACCQERLREHLLAHLVCPGRHTLSGLITVFGKQFEDWTSHYSLYAQERVDAPAIFTQVRKELEALGQPGDPLRVALDDTLLRSLNAQPAGQAARGRKRLYGKPLPTPEEIRADPSVAWQPVRARVNGKERDFEVKTLAPVRWHAAGENDLRLVIIRPVGFRPRKGARLSYTQTAYLICTDPKLSLAELLQEYVWRWDIELNHRDEKTMLGVGQAQVRNPNSAENIPASAVAAYAMLHVAAIKAYGKGGKPAVIPEAKWRRPHRKIRPSTQDLLNELRRELWAKAIRPDHLSDFMNAAQKRTKPTKSGPNLASSLFAATA